MESRVGGGGEESPPQPPSQLQPPPRQHQPQHAVTLSRTRRSTGYVFEQEEGGGRRRRLSRRSLAVNTAMRRGGRQATTTTCWRALRTGIWMVSCTTAIWRAMVLPATTTVHGLPNKRGFPTSLSSSSLKGAMMTELIWGRVFLCGAAAMVACLSVVQGHLATSTLCA